MKKVDENLFLERIAKVVKVFALQLHRKEIKNIKMLQIAS
jgi:hypothetical protein